jgi:hypothetical protein
LTRQHPAKNSISQPVGYHDKLAGARSAIAVHQKTITGEGKNTVLGGSDLSLKGPDQEVTPGAGEKKDMEVGAKTATAVHKKVAGGLREKVVPVASKNAKHKPESEITGGGENTVTGGSDLSLNGPDKEVTNGAGVTKDKAAGVKTVTAVDNEVNHGVGEKEVMIASENPQQGPESEIATTVNKDVANEKKNTDAVIGYGIMAGNISC